MRKTNQKKKKKGWKGKKFVQVFRAQSGLAVQPGGLSHSEARFESCSAPFLVSHLVSLCLIPLLHTLSLSLLNLPRSICQVPESTRVVPAPTPRIRGEVSVANSEPDTRWAFSKQLRLLSVLHVYVSAHRIIASPPRRTAAGLQSEARRRACARNPPIPGYRLVPKSTSIFALGPMQKCLKFICQLDTNVHAKGNYPHQDLTVVVKC